MTNRPAGTSQPQSSPTGVDRLLAAVNARPDAAACERCLADLAAYVDDQLAGAAYRDLHPETSAHLDACPGCAAAYARVYELALAEEAGRLPELPRREPDLSFMAQEAEQSLASRLAEALAGALTQVRDRVVLRLNEGMLPLLRPAGPALAVRSGDERYQEVLLRLRPEDLPPGALPLRLVAYRDARQPDHCLLEVVVEPLGRTWPDLAGIRVRLQGVEPPRQATTDAWGVVTFSDVPISALAGLAIAAELS